MNIGAKIKKLRKHRGWTQEQLAEECGLSKNAIWNYENGKRTPNIEMLNKVAAALHISLNDLLDFVGKSFSNNLVESILRMEYLSADCDTDFIDCYEFVTKGGNPDEYNFEVIRSHTGISIDSLKNCIENNIDLPIQEQIQLLSFWNEYGCRDDGVEFNDFIDANREEISKQPLISKHIKTILNQDSTKNNLEKMLDLLEQNSFQVSVFNNNEISISTDHGSIVNVSETTLAATYDDIIKKINSYTKFLIEEELLKTHV
jgi:transcriptional regulator with XRE-family HTH domain